MVAKNNPLKKRNLRVVKWLSSIPVAAVCTLCREFKVPMSAQANLIHLLDFGRGKNLPLQQVFSSGTTLAGIFRLARVPVELSNCCWRWAWASTVLELIINPDISGGIARASLKNLRLS
jgi:hypothetical protein